MMMPAAPAPLAVNFAGPLPSPELDELRRHALVQHGFFGQKPTFRTTNGLLLFSPAPLEVA
eukprot:11217662-Lingulodinium_polyedra.AAC.1